MIANTTTAPGSIREVARNDTAQSELDRADYRAFLTEHGITEEDTRAVTESGDVLQLPINSIEIRESEIQGDGLFAKQPFLAGDVIAPALLDGKKTQAGRFMNHSAKPNAKMVVRDTTNIDLVATREINDEEITTNYRETLWSRTEIIKPQTFCNSKLRLEHQLEALRE